MSDHHEATPIGKVAIHLGIVSVIVAVLFEIGCLGYYGLGLSSEPSALGNLKSGTWPAEVKSKIQTLYLYYFLSMYICVLAAALVYADPFLSRTFGHLIMTFVDFVVQAVVQGGKAFEGLKNGSALSPQKIAWTSYCLWVGAKNSPALSYNAGTARVGVHMTCVVVFALIALAFIAPEEKFAQWGGLLDTWDFCFLFFSIGAAFYPIWTTLGAIFFSLNFYGGLILYPINFMRHCQEAHVIASNDSGENGFCAVSVAVPMMLDVISIFSRVVVLVPPA